MGGSNSDISGDTTPEYEQRFGDDRPSISVRFAPRKDAHVKTVGILSTFHDCSVFSTGLSKRPRLLCIVRCSMPVIPRFFIYRSRQTANSNPSMTPAMICISRHIVQRSFHGLRVSGWRDHSQKELMIFRPGFYRNLAEFI